MSRLAMFGGADELPLYFSGLMSVPKHHPLQSKLEGRSRARIAIAMRARDRQMAVVRRAHNLVQFLAGADANDVVIAHKRYV